MKKSMKNCLRNSRKDVNKKRMDNQLRVTYLNNQEARSSSCSHRGDIICVKNFSTSYCKIAARKRCAKSRVFFFFFFFLLDRTNWTIKWQCHRYFLCTLRIDLHTVFSRNMRNTLYDMIKPRND